MEKRKKITLIVSVMLGIALLFTVIWGVSENKNAKALEITNENNYNRAFHEMVGHIDKVNSLLTKIQLAKDDAQMAKLSGDIFRESTAAKANLGQLPVTEIDLDKTSRFLSQVGDYTYVLSQNMINGKEISEEDFNNLSSMSEYAQNLVNTLSETESKINSGEIHIRDEDGKGKMGETTADAAQGGILDDMENVEKSFEEYPSLIYDGPFSEHIQNREPALLKDDADITREEAQDIAEGLIEAEKGTLSFIGTSENTQISAYMFAKETENGQISISVTKKGGHILSYLNNRAVGDEKLDINEAAKKAGDFLQSVGFYSMQQSYFDKSGGVATLNFAYVQDDVTCYSDLVKVKVALDNGEIIGLESNGYVMNHMERGIAKPKLTMEEAREYVSSRLNVSGTKLALIPKDSMREVLCYEFKGTFNDKNFLVYINADTGREEEIFILIENEDGVLTV